MTATDQRPAATPDRGQPANVPAEMAILGAMMMSKDAIGDISAILQGEDFYRPWHGEIYRTILELYGRGEPTDHITVAEHLRLCDNFNRNGGLTYLHDLVAAFPLSANAAYYARIVAEKAARRALTRALIRIQQLVETEPADIDNPGHLADRASEILHQAISRRDASDLIPISQLLTPTLNAIEEAGKVQGLRGQATGFLDLDRLLGGLRAGQLIVLAGRPGMGKSVLATDIARHISLHAPYKPVAFFSLEMSHDELMYRITSAETRVPLHAINEGSLTDNDWSSVAHRYGEIENAPLYIDETPNSALAEIRAKARRLSAQTDGLALVVVDYLQLMTSASRKDNREREVAEISRGLKVLAKELGCPVIAVAQLNRGPEQRADKRPQLADLRESGAIEADADVVILIHRDDYYDKESPRAGEADFIVAKNRSGPTDTITVAAQLHLSRFVDMAIE